MIYYGSLLLVALLAMTFYKNNNPKLALIAILIGVYIVYSDTTGYTATDFKNEMVDSANEAAHGTAKRYNVEKFDETKLKEEVE